MEKVASFALIFASCLCAFAPSAAQADSPIYVAVFEDFASSFNDQSSLTLQPHIRVAFQKSASGWAAMPLGIYTPGDLSGVTKDYPRKLDWTVVFDGKSIGNITSQSPEPLPSYGDIGIQKITSDPKQNPHISTGASSFIYSPGKVRTRPVLLVTAPNFKDPDGWNLSTLTANEKATVVNEFRKLHLKMESCDSNAETPELIDYSDKDLIVIKTYRSNKDEILLGLKLDSSHTTCDNYDDKNFYDYWFVMNREGLIKQLGNQMMPLDAADLGADGHSEWVFQTSRPEDEDGYKLFYDDFSKTAYFYWEYH